MMKTHIAVSYRFTLLLGLLCTSLVAQQTPPDRGIDSTSRQRALTLPGVQTTGAVLLPNGWTIHPAGTQLPAGDFPVNSTLSPDGKYIAVLHAGHGTHEIRVIQLETQKTISSVTIDQTFFGIAFSPDGTRLFASGAEDECVYSFAFSEGFLSDRQTLQIVDPKTRWVVSGIACLSDRELLVCGLLSNELARVDLENPKAIRRIAIQPESFPYAVLPSRDGTRAYVSLWGAASVAVIDLVKNELTSVWKVRSHPTEMAMLDGDRWLLVACSDDNSVVLLDTKTGEAKEVIQTAMYAQAKNGSTPASLDVSPDGKVLATANADNNNLALFEITERGKSRSLGFIPTGWYPTSVRFSQDGEQLIVTNGKGGASAANRQGPNPLKPRVATVTEYIGGLFEGSISLIPSPSPAQMSTWTKKAYECSPLNDLGAKKGFEPPAGNPIPGKPEDRSPIEHCIYIIKENRTYDQVFGDMPQGNGDPSLCIFPEEVTPNHHQLARDFVLLDNFYVESEVSADGHEWTMAAYATDFVEKAWPLSYREGRGKIGYPSEGRYKIAEPSSGYFWDSCREKGVEYFSFGEFVNNGPTIDAPATTNMAALEGHFDPQFRSYDLDYPDVKRAERFLARWKQFEDEGKVPGFTVVRLPNDHTFGTRIDKPTPTAMVAENDLALGMIVEGISKSRSWPKTAIFVVEDDAQNGADHVDAHRTVALVISPYVRRGTVDSTLYSTSSMLRTMGLILGLPPMTQFDAAATPMYNSFQSQADSRPYVGLPARVDIHAKNGPNAYGAKISEELDLSKEDAADDLLFGDIVWRSVKGADHPMPPPVRSAFVFAAVEDEEDEEEEDEED